ncbi:hypothetical protein CIB84_006036 [Bambusicola thoracicus]|uniref:Uncharacterized protein n=1 Tax=Bambusicola thoracicus TaxID=9083 RepID=A0A2P4T1I3_BAMTH|nr:hypothetical protein CIB84_006036 [Bambusicola thoracicus]
MSAAFQNVRTVDCELPNNGPQSDVVDLLDDKPIAWWKIKISNDGLTYSNAKTMIIYDGACQMCELQESGLCSLKKPLKIFISKEKIPQKLERIKPMVAHINELMIKITVDFAQLYADLIAKTMENALSPMSVNVYQVTVAPLVKKVSRIFCTFEFINV